MSIARGLAPVLALLLSAPTAALPGFETWVAQRDAGVVRQERDFSCGLAALATLLTYYYEDPTSERELLEELLTLRGLTDSEEGSAQVSRALSFAELASLGASRGYPVLGVSVHVDDILKLRRPVILALDPAGDAHFSVLRAVTASGAVHLADPSWGNLWLGRAEFVSRFVQNAAGQRGRLLIVGPRKQGEGGAIANDSYRRVSSRRALIAPARLSAGGL